MSNDKLLKLKLNPETFQKIKTFSERVKVLQAQIQLIVDTVVDCSEYSGKDLIVKSIDESGIGIVLVDPPKPSLVGPSPEEIADEVLGEGAG